MIAIQTPSGRTVEIEESHLKAVAVLIEDARDRAFDEVLEQLDRDYARSKECGDFVTAETLDLVKAKVRARKSALKV